MIGDSCSNSELGRAGSDNANRSAASSDFFNGPPSGVGGYAGVACIGDTASVVDTDRSDANATDGREHQNGGTTDSSESPVVCCSEENQSGAKEQTPFTPSPTETAAQVDPSSSSFFSDVSKCSEASPGTNSNVPATSAESEDGFCGGESKKTEAPGEEKKRPEVKTSSAFVHLSGSFGRDRAKSESGKDGAFASLGGSRASKKAPAVKTVESIRKSLIKYDCRNRNCENITENIFFLY